MSRCQACHADCRDAQLCRRCTAQLEQALAETPALVHELETTLARQTALGGQVGGRTAEEPLPYRGDASAALGHLRAVLVGWCRDHCETRGCWPEDTLDDIARHLLAELDWCRQHPAAGDLCSEILAATARGWRVVDRPPDRLYLGRCGYDGCDADLYVTVGAAVARCPRCRASVRVDERREQLLAAAEETLATATECARLVSVLWSRLPASTVWSYARRKRLVARGITPQGDPLYRLGDVLDLVREHVARRLASCQVAVQGTPVLRSAR